MKVVLKNELSNLVGKEIAEKIINSKETVGKIEGDNLKIGGEGMKGFYDKIIPEFMNKYTKKWGGKVGEKELTINNDSKLNNQYKEPRIVEKGNKFVIEAMSPNGEYNLVIKTFLTRAKAGKNILKKTT